MERLPKDIIFHIISYDKRFKIRKNKLIDIIPYDDQRRQILLQLPRLDRNAHAMLTDNDIYSLHVMVVVHRTKVDWTMYKYFKNIDVEEVMDGVVFSMLRIREPARIEAL